jgi:hypothetical protein
MCSDDYYVPLTRGSGAEERAVQLGLRADALVRGLRNCSKPFSWLALKLGRPLGQVV